MSTSIPSENTGPEFIPLAQVDVQPEPLKPGRARIDSIDLLRGIVMVVMMLEAGVFLAYVENPRKADGLGLKVEEFTYRLTPRTR